MNGTDSVNSDKTFIVSSAMQQMIETILMFTETSIPCDPILCLHGRKGARYRLMRWLDRMPPRRPARQNRGASRDYRLRLPCRPVRRPSSTSNARPSAQCLPHGESLPSSSQHRPQSGGRRIGPWVSSATAATVSTTALLQPIVDHVMFHRNESETYRVCREL
jgi:hypothetical protein